MFVLRVRFYNKINKIYTI